MSKTHTDLNQAKKLAKILPIESADMYFWHGYERLVRLDNLKEDRYDEYDIPCWSLSSLLDILKDNIKIEKTGLDQSNMFTYSIIGDGYNYKTHEHKELIDACYEMIVKLHRKNELVL